ncbi:MAG TPA: MarR family transcriptional regulator [Solirubrobacteraceae bacterium]|nr:MarR family transcriptional regulator [Solirubrobacteraceae bacterium]
MSSEKRALFEQLVDEIRRSQSATDRYDQAVADAIGLNRTDMRCLDTIQREGAVSAGRLAKVTGLTSGAMTAALDRLERRGFARRTADPADRRRVLVELDPAFGGVVEDFYGEHMARGEELYERYGEAELRFLLDFVRQGRELNEREAERLERSNRDDGAPG